MKNKIKVHNQIVSSKFPIDPFTMHVNKDFKTVEEIDKIVKEMIGHANNAGTEVEEIDK